MEFPFNLNDVLPGRITVIENIGSKLTIYDLEYRSENNADRYAWTYQPSANTPWDLKIKRRKEGLVTIIDELGLASAQAQDLRVPITSLKKLLNSSQHKIYIIKDAESRSVIGMLKVGMKRLFVFDEIGAHHEVEALCVLDFFVHESKQRCGFGHELFNIMLSAENVSPEQLAIDRPSFKCVAFLQKHYNLKNPVLQTNNYVIYPGFFQNRPVARPPIFLYKGKVPENSNSNFKQKSDSNKRDMETLQAVKVSLSSKDIKKNNTFYSSAGNCFKWNDLNPSSDLTSKKHHKPNLSPTYTGRCKGAQNWGVHGAMHSYPASSKDVDNWNTSRSTHCSLTPVDNAPRCSIQKWNQLQSSWNVLGVKPMDYSLYQKE